MNRGERRRLRARPVADAPIDGLLAEVEPLAKAWLLALLEQAPLRRAPEIAGGALTQDGPAVCDAVLRALADDHELARLQPGGALAELAAGAGMLGADIAPASVAATIEALRRTVWGALRAQLRRDDPHGPDPELVADLAERLALVCEELRQAGLGTGSPVTATDVDRTAPRAPEPTPPPAPPPPQAPPRAPERPPQRAPEPPALWAAALQEQIDRAPGGGLSLLLIELEDAERVIAADGAAGAGATFDLFTRALRGVARGQDTLVRETDTRAWLIAVDTGRAGALALGARVADAVATGTRWRGAPLTATVGVAVLGQDGEDALALIDAAEEARFAASASGRDVSR